MFTVKEYVVAESLDHAAELLGTNRNNYLIGGLLWLKMGRHHINRAIDISKLGLEKIEEKDDCFEIGAMATLRDIETHTPLNQYFEGMLAHSVSHIVGTQFRNCATVGGTIYSRMGFCDLLTALMVLDADVELYHGGRMSLADFAAMGYEKDILIKVIVKKTSARAAYLGQRTSASDFSIVAVAVSRDEAGCRIAVGARPGRAKLAVASQEMLGKNPTEEQIQQAAAHMAKELTFASNMRATADYRAHVATVLVRRALTQVCKEA